MKKPTSTAFLAAIPTELSREEVSSILKRLPNLPPPVSGFQALWKSLSIYMFLPFIMIGLCWALWMWKSPTTSITSENIPFSEKLESENLGNDPSKDKLQTEPNQTYIQTPLSIREEYRNQNSPLETEEDMSDQTEDGNLISTSSKIDEYQHSYADEFEPIVDSNQALSGKDMEEGKELNKKSARLKGTNGSTRYTLVDPFVSNNDQFADISLRKLRRVIRNKLVKDGLIRSRRDTIDIWLPKKEDLLYLNGQEIGPEKSLEYGILCEQFGVGFGSYRHIKITFEGIAVGDFSPQGFSGKALGKFSLDFKDGNQEGGLFDH